MVVTDIQFLDVINVLTTGVAGVVGWVVGRKKQKNDFLGELQQSINMLAEENKQQMSEIIKLRKEVIVLREENYKFSEIVKKMNLKLENVKTVTGKK